MLFTSGWILVFIIMLQETNSHSLEESREHIGEKERTSKDVLDMEAYEFQTQGEMTNYQASK